MISVIIPTYNRYSKLKKVLRALECQTIGKNNFEVIIVNDGSTEAGYSNFAAESKEYPFSIKYFSQKNKGAAAARNLGIGYFEGDYIIFIGDDTIPDKNLLKEHLHVHQHSREQCGVLGMVEWDKDLELNDIMRFIAPYGPQFNYKIHDPNNCGYKRFYTSNISLPAGLLKEDKFSENFKSCNFEDVELGYRLEKKGIRIILNKKAVVYHDQHYELSGFIERQKKVGINKRDLILTSPDLKNLWSTPSFLKIILVKDAVQVFLSKVLGLKSYYFRGLLEQTWIRAFLEE